MDIFSRVDTARASSQIVTQIKDAIRNGQLKVGDRLPSERELAEQLGVSRVTVRDALRVLEARGLLQIRVGAHGGSFVTAPLSDVVSEGLVDLLSLSDLSATEVTETRLILELGAVPLVCERRTSEDLRDLDELCEEGRRALDAGRYTTEASAAFHLRVVTATHNRAVVLMMEAIQDAIVSSLREAHASEQPVSEQGFAEHEQIVEAIKSRDVERAQRIMFEHLNRTAQRLNRVTGDGLAE
jgi:GntR family transcriptional regulator, transcriptional repressor for pyruvate dehydrogenase complex